MYDLVTKQQTEVTTGDDMTGYDTGGSSNIYGDKIMYVKRRWSRAIKPVYRHRRHIYSLLPEGALCYLPATLQEDRLFPVML
jgi:hypothetical protein